MADAGLLLLPPSYDDADGQGAHRAGSELKRSFESLKSEHKDIQELFRTVKTQLQSTPEIGQHHPLIETWEELRTKHKQIFRDSQQNASMCSRFLKNFSDILLPLSQSPDVPMEQKRVMIDKFLETIPVHMSTARQNAESFNELAKDVEVFPRKVATALRVQAQNVTLSDFVWNTLRQLCADLWMMINEMLNKIVDIFKTALERIDKLQFNTCFGVSLDVHMRPHYPSLELPPSKAADAELTPRELQRAVEDNAATIANKLSAFEGAWHVVGNACSQLSADLELAKGFTMSSPPVPQAVDHSLKAAALVHEPLVESLGSYSLCN